MFCKLQKLYARMTPSPEEVMDVTQRKPMTRLVRPLRGGQITIPAEFRKQLGITEQSLLQLTLEAGELHITPVRLTKAAGSPWLKELYDAFAPGRQEVRDKGYREEEVDDAIDQALQAVRAHPKP